ncbi:MAG: CDP-diacylglycerol--glycerol-3-phosphate 3-phosphatidyltransferase [Candidatus Marinimicrobia bacterium]|nr:CDP-diacylglycerol--glycerol-3-phosphate 3-phosphatidyltransferase [Candidatus Neomarinimicrobiota bacterium]
MVNSSSLPHPWVAWIPNILTYLRIILTPVFLILLFSGGYVNYLIALLVFIVASTSDVYDGYLARKYNIVTEHGKFLDPLADKILVLSAFFSFWYMEFFPFWMLALIILRDVVITGLRMWMLAKDHSLETSIFGKSKTAAQMTGIYVMIVFVLLENWPAFGLLHSTLAWIANNFVLWIMMLIVTLLTVGSGVHYLKVNWLTITKYLSGNRA